VSVSAVAAGLCAALLTGQLVTAAGAAAAEACSTSSGAGGAYTVTLCVTAPDGALSAAVPLSATATVEPGSSPTPPSVEKVVFSYAGEYLLTDHDPEPGPAGSAMFGMTWRTDRTADGTGVLEAKLRLTDAYVTTTTTTVTLANGVTVPAANTRQFRVSAGTPVDPGQRFRLAAVGDGASGSPGEAAVVDLVASWRPNLLAYLGDVYERGSPHEFDNWYGPPGSPAGYGRFRAITNPVIGNHEYLTPGGAGYFDYWDNIPHYYSYDAAGWHFVALDSSAELGQLHPGSAQYEWLAADLGANRARCTVVYMHHPRFSVAEGGGRPRLSDVWSLLAARRVTLAIAGHAHSYERWTPLDGSGSPDAGGVTQLVAGAGGYEVVPGVRNDARLASAAAVSGALRLDLGSDDVAFSYVDTTGRVMDAGAIGCKSTGDPLPPTTPTGLLASARSSTTATLAWQPSTDQYTSVDGYTVRRDGVVVATLGAASTSYVDNALTPGTTYTWTVDAFDPSRNYSAQSAPAALTMPAAAAPSVSSRALLRQLVRAKEHRRGYDRRKFRSWTDADRDGCTTRNEVLVAEATRPPTIRPGCGLTGGRWFSWYDGVTTGRRPALRVDHLVPLREAWESGAHRWRTRTRRQLTNDLGYGASLTVVSAKSVRAKGSAEPHRWMPPRPRARCGYLAQWVAVKWRWRLRVDADERRFLARRLSACDWPTVERPGRPG
jgi:hypothetical protein